MHVHMFQTRSPEEKPQIMVYLHKKKIDHEPPNFSDQDYESSSNESMQKKSTDHHLKQTS